MLIFGVYSQKLLETTAVEIVEASMVLFTDERAPRVLNRTVDEAYEEIPSIGSSIGNGSMTGTLGLFARLTIGKGNTATEKMIALTCHHAVSGMVFILAVFFSTSRA